MDTQVKGTVVFRRETGNVIADAISSFYTGEQPTVVHAADKVVHFVRFNTEVDKMTKAETRRESFAVVVSKIDADAEIFGGVKGHKFLNDLIAEYQFKCVKACANGELPWNVVEDAEKMIDEYNDDSRAKSGRKVTKEKIIEWFLENCSAYVSEAALLKNAQMTPEVLDRVLKNYADMFSKLTNYGLENVYSLAQMELVNRILSNSPTSEDDEIGVWVRAKMVKMAEMKAATAELIDAI